MSANNEVPSATVLNPRPRVTEIEQHGINTIPDADRTSTWLDLLRIQFGGANTFATVLLGTIPILLGLSFWQAVLATVSGLLVGIVFLAPMGLFGPKTGTNNAVSSGAFFGVRGRVVGSFLSLLTAIAFYSISVWVSGDALVGGMFRLAGIPDSIILRTIVYAVIGLLVIVVVVYGYQFMLLVNKTAVIANTVLMLLAFVAFAGVFNAGYDPGPSALALGGFWPTFILAALIVMGNPISFGAFLGDWSRYIPASTPPRKIFLATILGQLLTLVPFLFGVATATIVAGQADYVFALIQASPIWYAVLLMVVAFIGGLSTGTTSLYGTGLDFSSVFPSFTRVRATITIGVAAFVFILAGRIFFDLLGAVNAFIGAIVVTTTPWMVIMAIGY
ncbi:MAG: cytosine permease, partial [Rhodoglobus sp.]